MEERIIELSDCGTALEAFGSEAERLEAAAQASAPAGGPDLQPAPARVSADPSPEPAMPRQPSPEPVTPLQPSPAPGPPVHPASAAHVSVADLDAAGVRTEWYEAIAIVGALCRTILDSGDEIGPAKIDRQQVFISAAGDVTTSANGSRSAPAAVGSVGKILDTLLPQQDVMYLRPRLVSKATSTPPHYNTLSELSQAIAYYERPNRAQIIQGVYCRCYNLSLPQRPTETAAAAPAVIPPPEDEQPAEKISHRTPPRRVSREMLLVAASCMMLSAIATGAILFMRQPRTAGPEAVAIDAPDQGGAEAETTPNPSNVPSGSHTAGPYTAPSAGSRSSFGQKSSASSVNTPAAEGQIAASHVHFDDAQVGAKYLDDVRAALNQKIVSLTPGVERPVASSRALADETSAAGAIYGVGDGDVVPPSVLYPRFLTATESGKRRADIFLVEIVVNERGEVESVKGRNSPRNIGDSLFLMNALSAAKSWRFTPAVKGNYRVKYRHLFELARY
jgi:hypothetical protein